MMKFCLKFLNLIYLQLRRVSGEIYYVKQPHYEIDFLLREGRSVTELNQVAWSLEDPKTRGRELKALINGAKDFKCSKQPVKFFLMKIAREIAKGLDALGRMNVQLLIALPDGLC